jgi:hypothetical protein
MHTAQHSTAQTLRRSLQCLHQLALHVPDVHLSLQPARCLHYSGEATAKQRHLHRSYYYDKKKDNCSSRIRCDCSDCINFNRALEAKKTYSQGRNTVKGIEKREKKGESRKRERRMVGEGGGGPGKKRRSPSPAVTRRG